MHQANKNYKIFPLRQRRALTKSSLSPQIDGPILLIVKSCNAFYVKQQTSNVITNVSTEERSKEERSELKRELESMEENPDSPKVIISVMPNMHKKRPSAAQDEQAPSEQFEEVPAQDLNEPMMYND